VKLLVTGGAGYVGSHFVWDAVTAGHQVTVIDHLERGHREMVHPDAKLVVGDIRDRALLDAVIADVRPDTVLHYAAYALVGESVEKPNLYDDNNVGGTRSLLEAMGLAKSHANFIFSSSCAVFGAPTKMPIAEDDPKQPLNPYGETKLRCETLIKDFAARYGFAAVNLRYFNACGAHTSAPIGEAHDPETHLIPNILKAVKVGGQVTIHGADFPTRDGTCIRDYIHVMDLARAHLLAAEWLKDQPRGSCEAIHLGTGEGHSNLEVLRAAEAITKQTVPYRIGPRRAGDPPELVADPRRSKAFLHFEPTHSSLETIVHSAWRWHSRH